jgi:hypothetical protein
MTTKVHWKGTDPASPTLVDAMLHDSGFEGKQLMFAARGFALDYLRDHVDCTMGEWSSAVHCYCKGYVDSECLDSIVEHLPGVARLWGGD